MDILQIVWERSIYISDATQDLKGYLDDFRIYDKALSDFEVKQIYSGYTVSREKGHVSPYSYYWNGSTTDNNDNAYIEATGTATPMADITTANSMTISYYKKLEGTVSKNASLSPDFNILSGSTNRISVGVNAIVETFTYTVESAGTPGQTQYDITFAKDTVCDILIVGGGGGGGKPFSGGGGGGEVIYFQNKNIPSGSYTIKVGKGGSGSTVNNRGSNGEQSEAFLAISSGGGGGGGYSQYNHASGLNGGCGGGAGYNNTTNGIKQLTDNSGSDIYSNWGGTNNQYAGDGNDGGASGGFAGGGGGAGGSLSSLNPDGNDGIQINIDGNNHYWAGGGGGYSESSTDAYHSGDGGKGGGGGGSGVGGDSNDGKGGTGGINIGGPALDTSSGNGGDGGVHTGGGGGGTQLGYGGNGGSGIVIIRYSKQHIKLNDTSYETNVAFDLNVWYRWTFTYDGTNAKIYMMNIGNTALTPTPISQVGQELTPTFTGWNADETFDKVLIGGGSNSLPDASPAYLEDIRMYNTSFTEEDVKNLSLYNIPTTTTVSSGSGTVDLSDVGTGSYVLKLPEAPYGGYKDHINDLIVWYKFEKTPNGELRNYGKDSKYYGIVNNSGIAKPELVFSDSSTTVDTKFRLLELENNKLDKIHILDTNLKYDGTGDSNITYTVTPTSNINVDILVVGGGGGGGSAGAGGADVEYIQNYELTAGTEYTFKVGKGGDIGNIGGPSEMTSNLTNLYKVLGGGNGGSLTLGSTITEVFEYDDTHDTKGLHTWTKPTGLTEVTAYVWGAGGGGGYDKASNRKGQDGGNGGFIYCKINVTSINNLYIYAGQGGVVAYRDASSSLSVDIKSFGGGGSAKTGYSTSDTHGIGGGGGLSGIFEYDSSFSTDATNNTIGESAIPIVIAGGGGGGGTYMSGTTYHGGDAGSELLDMTTGDFIWPGSDAIANAGKQNYEGKGGGVSAVTTFAANTIKIAGGKYYGGSDVTVNNFSSGGGSGYFGGSTGYHDSSGTIASSGGGSSYVKNLQTSNATNIYNNTIGNQPGNYGYMPGRKGIRIDISVVGRSISSKLSEMTGGNGLIVLEYTPSISSPPIASATSGGGLVLTDPLEYHSPLLALGKGFTGGNYYYESNLDGTLINYAGGGGGSASSGTDATTLGGGKGGAGLYYSITTINTEYGKGGNSFEGSSLNIEMQKADLTYEKLNIDLDNKTTFVIDDPNIYNDFNIGPFDYTHPEDSSKYTMFMFRYNDINNANNQTTYKLNLNIGIDVKIFVIGGGGAGGSAGTEADGDSTSGGGGGGMAYKKITINKSTYNIIVGRGGYGTDGSVSTGRDGEDGYSSSFLNLIAYGGKGGKIGGSSSSTDYITADGGLGGSSTGGDINGTGGNGGHNAAYPNLAKVSAGSGGNGTNNAPGGGGGAQGYTSNNGSGGNGGNGNSNYFTGGGGGGPADSTNTNEQGLGGIGFYSGGRGGIKGITEANKGTSGDGPGGGLAIPGISRSNNGGGGGSFGGGGGGHCDYGNSDDASGNNGGTGGYGGDGVVILLLPEIIPSSSSSTPSITSSLPATIIKPTTTNPTLVKNNINEVYYEFTAQETIQFIQTISATVFATNGTNMINETIIFEPHKLYEIDPDTAQITTTDDSATNIIISPLATGKTSTITGESLSYDNPTIIIKYSRLTTYEYGKGGDLNTTGNSGAIIIRYNYYDQTTNPQRVILQKPGYLNPYSYVWRGNATQPVDDSYISINDPAGILNNRFLSINFWLERDTTTTSKDYIFAITEHNPYNELLGIGLDSSNLFVNILGSSNTTLITSTDPHCHYSVEIDYSANTYAVYTTTIASEERLDTATTVSTTTLVASTAFTPTITLESSNLYSKEIKATIGDIFDDNIVDYELSPHGIEDFRIYNKTLTTVIADVAPVDTTKYHTLFMTGYKASSATGVTAIVNPAFNIDLQFYNLHVADGGILKNIGNRTSEFNALIYNNTYSNQDVITHKVINAEAPEELQGKYGFEWNKIDTAVFKKNYYEGEDIALEISDLKIISDYSVVFDLTLKADITTYPVEIINKNNELVVRLKNATTIVIAYFLDKVKYFKELPIEPLVVDTKKSFDIVIDKETNDVAFKVDAGASITAGVVDDLKVWYQFEDNKTVKNYSKSSYSNLELNVESNISFISGLSSDIDVDYASPYSYYTFLPGEHSFKVENEMKCDMLMVGGGGMSPPDFLKAPGGGGGEVKLYNELTLQPGDYTVIVGEGGYDTTLLSNSVVIYKALSGNLNNGGKAELNSNANPDVLHGFEGGDGYYDVVLSVERQYPSDYARLNYFNNTKTYTAPAREIYNVENTYATGEYIVETSSFNSTYPSYPLVYIFNSIQSSPHYAAMSKINYNMSSGVYEKTYNNKYIDNGYEGDWVYIKLPTRIQLTKYSFAAQSYASAQNNRLPGKFRIYGATNDTDWNLLVDNTITLTDINHAINSVTNNAYLATVTDVNDFYNRFLIVFKTTISYSIVNMSEFNIFGKEISGTTFAGGGGGMGSTGDPATSTSGGKGGIGIYHSLNPYGISYEYGAGGNAIGKVTSDQIYDKTPLQPNYGLYTVLPWNQHQLTDIKDIVSFKVWNETTQKYELPTTDFVFDKELMDMSITPNYTGLYTFVDSDDEYYLYTFKYVDTIPVQTFEYKLTAESDFSAYIFEKSHDRKEYIEGNNKDITIYVGDTVKFINNSGTHPLVITTEATDVSESSTITEHTFTVKGDDYSYYCVTHPEMMKGNITVLDRPTDSYENSLGQTQYQLDIKRNVNADILIVSSTNAKEYNTIKLSGTMLIDVGDTSSSVSTYDASSDSTPITSSILGTSSIYSDPIVIIRFSKSNIENVLTNFGRGANAGQLATPGLLVLKTDNNQILTTETTKHPKLPYSYVWSGKTDTASNQVLVKSTEDFTIPTNLTLTFWYYESVNDDEKTEIIKITDTLKVSSTATELVFTVGDSAVNIPRPNKYEWNFYGLIFDGTDDPKYASVYVNDMLVKTETVANAPSGIGKIILGISTSGVAKIADYRIYESPDVLNITEQYSSLGNVGVLDVFGTHLTEYDIKENKVGKGYLSLNQNNVKTKIFNNSANVEITYKFKGTEQNKYYPIIQFTDYINGIIAPKVEITMKTTKLFVSVIINNKLIEKEYNIDCSTLKLYSVTIYTDETIVATQEGATLAHTPGELIALYSFENNDTANDQNVVNLVGESILSNMTICNIELSTKAISGTTQQTAVDIGDNYHYYEIKESGTLTFAKETRVDMVLVGGGAGGGPSNVGTEYYGEPGEVTLISTYLEGTYQIEIGVGGESNMPGSNSTIIDTNTGLEVYSANGGLTNVEYIDTTYSNVYSTYDFGNGEKKFAGYGINIPGVDVVVSDPEVVANDTTYSLNTLAEDKTGVKGWRIVRFLPATATAWHQANDDLVGTAVYGNAYNYSEDWSVEFGNFDEFLFGTGGLQHWMWVTKDTITNADATSNPIIKSSESDTAYSSPGWYTGTNPERPLISLHGWDSATSGDSADLTEVMYVEGTYADALNPSWTTDGGMAVWVRSSTDPYRSLVIPYSLYTDTTHSLQSLAEFKTGVNGWRIVRFLPDGLASAFSSTDNLVGTDVYGNSTDFTTEWSIEFQSGGYDQYLFVGGSFVDWLILNKTEFIPLDGSYNEVINAVKSSVNPNPHTVKAATGTGGDRPLIALTEWGDGKHLYQESSGGTLQQGAGTYAERPYYIFVRSSTATETVNPAPEYKTLSFTHDESADDQTEYTVNFTEETECDILIVGGGGAGADSSWVGGGGAGGLIYYKKSLTGSYKIKVGKGGGPQENPVLDDSATTATNNIIKNGSDSEILDSFDNVLFKAVGGSMGMRDANKDGLANDSTFDGGSSGGSGYPGADLNKYKIGNLSSNNVVDGTTVLILSAGGEDNNNDMYDNTSFGTDANGNQYGMFGSRGGASLISQRAGGGGGAGSVGENGTAGDNGVGSGGDGKDMSLIFGSNAGDDGWFAGGGGGGGKSATVISGLGGKGGGGDGNYSATAESGLTGTGGGGGASDSGIGGNGGSGIVIIRYKTTGQAPEILYPGTGGKTELPGTAGILALREYRPSGQQYSITRTAGYNLPYSYEWSGMTNEHSDKNYLYSTVSSTTFLNTDFTISLWCYLNNTENISLLSIQDVLEIYVDNQELVFELSDGKATTIIKRDNKWQNLLFVRSNSVLEIYVNNVNKSKLIAKPSVDIVDAETTLYINKSATIVDNFINPMKISDLRIYSNASKYIINKLANLPKDQYCYIGANQITDIAPSVLSDFKVNNVETDPLTATSITYHPVTVSTTTVVPVETTTEQSRDVTINTVIGNQSLIAYEWSNLEASESLKLSNLYMSVNNGKDLVNKFYNGFEFSTTYWFKFSSDTNEYEIKLASTEHTILELKNNADNLLEASFNITNNSNEIITTTLDQELVQDHWYLIGLTAGISDKYVSLSLAAYDASFDGSTTSYISSSALVPQVSDYNYNINTYTNELKINAKEYGDVKYYNRFITLVDIYNILTDKEVTADTLTLTGTTETTVSLIGDSTDSVSFDINLVGGEYQLSGVDSLGNSFTNTSSSSSSVQTIKIIKGTELTLNVSSSSDHPFIIVKSNVNPSRTSGSDSNKYTTDVTYDETTTEKYNSGQINGSIVWDTKNSDLGLYYGICVNHTEMYFIIELTTGSDTTINTVTEVESTISIDDIHKYYRIHMSFAFSKNDVELSADVSDLIIRSDTKTYLKFIAGHQPTLKLYSDTEEQTITTTHTTLSPNVWYDFYVTLKYDGTDTTGEIYIGKDNSIEYSMNYSKPNFIPFKGIDSTDTLEVRVGVNEDEQPEKLNKKIENINIFTKKLNRYTINNLIKNNAVAIIQPTTIEANKLELWYRLNDFTNNNFDDTINDSSGKSRSGVIIGTSPTQEVTKINNKEKSNKLLKSNFKAMKITDATFNISTPAITLNNNFSIMIKSKLGSTDEDHNVFTYNDLRVDISSTKLKVKYGSTVKDIEYTFADEWYGITLVYNKNKTKLSVYINEELKGKYNSVNITTSTNILKLSDYLDHPTPTTIALALEDLRILSNEVKYQTIYEYVNGINIT